MNTLGLDIGGASIKSFSRSTGARFTKFQLWREPTRLFERLRAIVEEATFDRVAVTMTGELCDCFRDKAVGVAHILEAVVQAVDRRPVFVLRTDGAFLDVPSAIAEPWSVAASNWVASATWSARRIQQYSQGLFIDVGSTTTDLIPLIAGRVTATGRTDPERLASRELVYLGVERTPICALLESVVIDEVDFGVAAELFATSLDAFIVTGEVAEDGSFNETADGKPALIEEAIARLARCVGSDPSRFGRRQAVQIGRAAIEAMTSRINDAVTRIAARTTEFGTEKTGFDVVVLAGQGERFIRRSLDRLPALRNSSVVSWAETLSPAVSTAACAFAVAELLDATESESVDS